MFEGKPPRPADARPLEEQGEAEALRPLTWGDLVARLSAARELRASCVEEGDASFDAGSARCIAAHHNGKLSVNLDDSSNRKSGEGTAAGAAYGAGADVTPDATRK
jgi:hypothetical protein